jgi:hypothetical protein
MTIQLAIKTIEDTFAAGPERYETAEDTRAMVTQLADCWESAHALLTPSGVMGYAIATLMETNEYLSGRDAAYGGKACLAARTSESDAADDIEWLHDTYVIALDAILKILKVAEANAQP